MSRLRLEFESARAAMIAEPQPPNTRINVPRNSAPHFFRRMPTPPTIIARLSVRCSGPEVQPDASLTQESRRFADRPTVAAGSPGLQSAAMRRPGGIATFVAAVVVAAIAVPAAAGTTQKAAHQKQQAGGEVVWGLDAETPEGWCLPSSQLAAAGIVVANAIYDTLVTINSKRE